MTQKGMRRRRDLAGADDGGDVAIFHESEAEFQVHFGVGNRGETETSGGDIVKMRHDVGKTGQRHFGRGIGLSGPG